MVTCTEATEWQSSGVSESEDGRLYCRSHLGDFLHQSLVSFKLAWDKGEKQAQYGSKPRRTYLIADLHLIKTLKCWCPWGLGAKITILSETSRRRQCPKTTQLLPLLNKVMCQWREMKTFQDIQTNQCRQSDRELNGIFLCDKDTVPVVIIILMMW